MCILKSYINIIYLVFVLKCLVVCACTIFFVLRKYSDCRALNFMEWKLSGSFWLMSGFTTGLLLFIHSQSGEKGSFLDCSRLIFIVN